jgi:subtilisin family serine protease
MKVDPDLSGASVTSQEITTTFVVFFEDVTSEEAATILAQHTPEGSYVYNHTWEVPRDATLIDTLAQEESVRWLTPGPPPPQTDNDVARAILGTEELQNAAIPASGEPTYLGLTGRGVVIAHSEDNADTNHGDLTDSVIAGGYASTRVTGHATHVAGIMVGSGEQSAANFGTNRQWRGHALGATVVSMGFARARAHYYYHAVHNYGAKLSNHSYHVNGSSYDAIESGIDEIIRGDTFTEDGTGPIFPHLAVRSASNAGMDAGFYSVRSPSKNSLIVGAATSGDQELWMSSSKGPTFDGRIKPDVTALGTNIASTDKGGGYVNKSGTSMATPATTGVLALMLEQYYNTYGAGTTPQPATLKALLVNTADDIVHTASDNSDRNDPDLCRDKNPSTTPDPDSWIPYGPGPDFATGYGIINAVGAVNAVRGGLFLEESLSPAADSDSFTLAWDDEPGDGSLASTAAQLVNDLDLRLIAPDGTENYPFTLDPLPIRDDLVGSEIDPIDQEDITDAYRADDDRNNVEQVVVENPAPGTWTARVTIEGGFPEGEPQPYSLVGDTRLLNIVAPQTGNFVVAGDPADPNVVRVVMEATNGLNGADSSLIDVDAGDFSVSIDGTPAIVVNALPVGDQFWLNVRPQTGVYNAGSKYDLTVTLDGFGVDTETRSVLFTEREVVDRAIVLDSSGSMSDESKMVGAQDAAQLFVDQSLVGDRIAVVEFDSDASVPYAITEVSDDPLTPELNDAKDAISAQLPGGTTAVGAGLLKAQGQITAPPR